MTPTRQAGTLDAQIAALNTECDAPGTTEQRKSEIHDEIAKLRGQAGQAPAPR